VEKRLIGSGCRLKWRAGSVDGWVYSIGVEIARGEGAISGVNLGRPVVTNGVCGVVV